MSEGIAVGLVLFIVGLALSIIGVAGAFSWIQFGFGVPMAIVGALMLIFAAKSNG